MAADLDAFLNTDDFGEVVVYTPNGAASGFNLPMDIGDGPANPTTNEAMREQDRLVPALCKAADVAAGILAKTGRARGAGQGDEILCADGRQFGVQAAWLDGTGAQQFTLSDRTVQGATNARDVG
jgi:hypothetical protein